MSQLDSNLDDAPLDDNAFGDAPLEDSGMDEGPIDVMEAAPRGVIIKKPGTSIYTVLLMIATLAMMLGCLFLFLERARYGF